MKLRYLAWKYWCIWSIILVVLCFFIVLYAVNYVFEQQAYKRWEKFSYVAMNKYLEEGQKLDEKTGILKKLQDGRMQVQACKCNCSKKEDLLAEENKNVQKIFVDGKSNKFWCKAIHEEDSILILTPAHKMGTVVKRYFRNLLSLDYPHCLIRIAVGMNQDDEETFNLIHSYAASLEHNFRQIDIVKLDISSSNLDLAGIDRHIENIQLPRRSHLAQVRNSLLFHALGEEKFVLWLDSDVRELPKDLIKQLMSAKKDIIVPSCMYRNSPKTLDVYDKNSWRETKLSNKVREKIDENVLLVEGYKNESQRLYLNDLQSEGPVVELDGIGGCCLLVKADVHKRGIIFLPFVYKNHIETEGFAQAAKTLGYKLHGMPFLQVIH